MVGGEPSSAAEACRVFAHDVAGDWGLLERTFRLRFGVSPSLRVQAPGRVNLIGEHTDYNDGFVLPAAIDRYVRLVAGAGDRQIRLRSLEFDGEVVFSADDPRRGKVPAWGRYVQGVAAELQDVGIALQGLRGVLGGTLPAGAGLSSSAALEVAVARALLHLAGVSLPLRNVALLAQRAEAEFVGVPCGIMDQFTVALARPGHALLLDCRTLQIEHIPLMVGAALVVCDTGVRRDLARSAYALRRGECAEAVHLLRQTRPDVRALRDLGHDDLALVNALPEPVNRRARHVVTEIQRVLDAATALRRGDLATVGRLLDASHASLRDDFEVSGPELDVMVASAREAPGCLGARLTGAGFGGAVVALVADDAAEQFVATTGEAYRRLAGREGQFLRCTAVGGAEVVADRQP